MPFVDVAATDRSPTDRAIAVAQERLREDPSHRKARLALAQAFVQKGRETADAEYYAKAQLLLDDLRSRSEPEAAVLVALGSLALARHDFAAGLELGREAVDLAPGDQSAQGVVVDALNELGRYDAALEATQRMVDTKPNIASLSRASYARELHGDLAGAIQAMADAARAGAGGGENTAYVEAQLGLLLLTAGRFDEAEAAFDAADTSFPGFAPAMVGRARVRVAQGELDEAVMLLAEAAERQPTVETLILQGDTLAAAGDEAGAARAYEQVQEIIAMEKANGVDVDGDIALFAAERDPGPDAVAAARRTSRKSPNIFNNDGLAWNLYRVGKVEQAREAVSRALRTGTRDPSIRFHAAVIADAAGDREEAVEHLRSVLETNPRFSPRHLDDVPRLARKLGLDGATDVAT